jgi:hypothetical protein
MHDTLHQPSLLPRRSNASIGVVARRLRAIFGGVLAASILTAAVGCDKRAQGEPALKLQTSLAGRPTVLFLLFGERSDPRLLPVATIGHGHVTAITLDPEGWRKFDQLYFKAGSLTAIYQDGSSLGNAVIRRGMWEGNEPLYRLPGCRALRPLAAASFANAPDGLVTLELLATSDPLPSAGPRPHATAADLDSARAVVGRIAQREGLTAATRGELELTVSAIRTGVSSMPTLIGSYTERGGGTAAGARHLFVIADSVGSASYGASFVHSVGDSTPEFRRYIDHVDLTGDGVDEIVLEGWRAGGDSFLVIMKYGAGRWHEIARGANNWCADAPKR